MKQTNTQQARAALLAAAPLRDRGHAFQILKAAGLTGSGAVFNAAVKAYEAERGPLGQSAAASRQQRDADLRAKAHQMSASDVRAHIAAIAQADPLFWACWNVFKNEGKWAKALTKADFANHFRRPANGHGRAATTIPGGGKLVAGKWLKEKLAGQRLQVNASAVGYPVCDLEERLYDRHGYLLEEKDGDLFIYDPQDRGFRIRRFGDLGPTQGFHPAYFVLGAGALAGSAA